MNLFKRLLHKKAQIETPPLPSWDEIVELMYDKELNFVNQVVQVIYAKDKERRYVITHNKEGLLFYQLEILYMIDEDEWQYNCLNKNEVPAHWEPDWNSQKSVFNSMDELMMDLKSQPEYKLHFSDNLETD